MWRSEGIQITIHVKVIAQRREKLGVDHVICFIGGIVIHRPALGIRDGIVDAFNSQHREADGGRDLPFHCYFQEGPHKWAC